MPLPRSRRILLPEDSRTVDRFHPFDLIIPDDPPEGNTGLIRAGARIRRLSAVTRKKGTIHGEGR